MKSGKIRTGSMCVVVVALCMVLLFTPRASAQFVTPSVPADYEAYRFDLGWGPGINWNITKGSAWGPSFTVQVSCSIAEHWRIIAAPTWDLEIEHKAGKTTRENNLGAGFGVTYSFDDHWGITAGYQFGFANDGGGKWKFETEHVVGVAPGYTGSISERWFWAVGPTFSYSVTNNEFNLTVDALFGFVF
jgi:long-subunit fatty acid transport protein